MSSFSQDNYSSFYNPNYQSEFNQFQNQPLDFQQYEDYSQTQIYNPSFSGMPNDMTYLEAKDQVINEEDELPLLEELEIYPDRIIEKMTAVLNPFRGHALTNNAEYLTKDSDLVGPIAFYLMLAMSLFINGNKANFGYIYGVTVVASILMYGLLNLMTSQEGIFSLVTVSSILGYCIIPVVGLSLISIFFTLQSILGFVLSLLTVLWSSYSASRLFVTISGDKEQQGLIAYPCSLVAGVYVLMIIF